MVYYNQRVGFSDGGEFTLSGTDYIGYYFRSGNSAYSSEALTYELEVLPTFSTDIIMSDIFADRLISDISSIPYTFQHVEIHPGEDFNGRILNDRINKLYKNTLYLYSRCFLANNNIPIGYDRVGGVAGGTLTWIPQTGTDNTTMFPFSAASLSQLDNVIDAATLNFDNNEGYSHICISSSNIIALSSDSTLQNLTVVYSSSKVDYTSMLNFDSLSSISVTGHLMYVVDSVQNNVYRYDISGLVAGDVTLTNKVFLTKFIGGRGNSLAKTKFNSPDVVYASVDADRVYVHDKGNKCVKVFDSNLTHITTRTTNARRNILTRCFGYNTLFNFTYLIEQDVDANTNTLFICDTNLNTLESFVLEDQLTSTEYFRKIEFSKADSNIVYVVTNENVFKKFLTSPARTIGKWLFYKSGLTTSHVWNYERSRWNKAGWSWSDGTDRINASTPLLSFSTLNRLNTGDDDIFVYAGSTSKSFNKILHYREPSTYRSVLGVQNSTVYRFDQSNVDNDEFIQGFVINKEIYKIVKNLLFVKNYIQGRYSAEYDFIGNLVFSGITALTNDELQSITMDSVANFYIHENEVMNSPGAINRVLKRIADLQSQLSTIISTKITNFVPSLSGSQTIVLI